MGASFKRYLLEAQTEFPSFFRSDSARLSGFQSSVLQGDACHYPLFAGFGP